MRRGGASSKRRKVDFDGEADEELDCEGGDETEQALDALMDENDATTAADLDQDEAIREDADAPDKTKWTVGILLRSVGVDPVVFGWNEEEEDFL